MPGSIYHAIAQLEKQGLLAPAQSVPPEKLGPAKTEYVITSSGEAAFLELLRDALRSFSIEQFSAGIAFMEFLPRDEVVALLSERSTGLRENSMFLRTLPTEPIPSEPSKHPELLQIWVAYTNEMAVATDEVLRNIRAGSYKFKGEQEEKL